MTRTLILAAAALGLLGGSAFGQPKSQFYSEWKYSAAKGYHYCYYYYKSNPAETTYKQQYVIYNPKDPNWVYWCNPKDNPDNPSGQDKFWGRCPTKANAAWKDDLKAGKDVWSLLPKDKRPSKMADLAEADFPEAKNQCPPVPGSNDGRTIPCPPDPPNLPE